MILLLTKEIFAALLAARLDRLSTGQPVKSIRARAWVALVDEKRIREEVKE